MNSTALPTLSDQMETAMQLFMVAAMHGDQVGKETARAEINRCADQIKNGEYQ